MKDLVAIDPQTGQRDNCGVITKRRAVGDVTIYLTYDEPNRFWWIVWQDDQLRKMGFVEARREVCWELFESLDESALADLRERRSTLPNRTAPEA